MKCKSACLFACLTLLSTACTAPPKLIPKVEVQRVTPPASLLQPCPPPSRPGPTIGDALDYIPEVLGELAACNHDKALLREWAEDAERH